MWHKKLGATISPTQVRSSGDQLAQISQLPDDDTVRVAACSIGSFALARLRTFSGKIEREFSAILGSREWAGMDLDGIDASRDDKRQTPCSLNRQFLGGDTPVRVRATSCGRMRPLMVAVIMVGDTNVGAKPT
ncbi:MAG: hypothetical protein Q8O80_21265 [Devosia sp.]|nr:hypothetical protein [Devosia sp.]